MIMTIDYQDFTNISTTKAERRDLYVGDIYSNSLKCLKCNEDIRSKNRHDFVTCSCGNVSIDGGSWYSKVSCNDLSTVEDTSILYKDVEDIELDTASKVLTKAWIEDTYKDTEDNEQGII